MTPMRILSIVGSRIPGRKRAFAVLLTCAFFPSLTPCAQSKTIRFWCVGQSADALMYRDLAKQFEAETGIEVRVQPVPWGSFETKYLTALAAGVPPDAGTGSLGGPGDYGRVGALVDMRERYPEIVEDIRSRYLDGIWEAMEFRGHLYGIPGDITLVLTYYRKDIFAELGLEPPRDWDELWKTVRKLNSLDYDFGYAWTRDNWWPTGMFWRPYGGRAYSPDGSRLLFGEEPIRSVSKKIARLWNMPLMAIDKPAERFALTKPGQAQPYIVNGSYAYYEYHSRFPELREFIGVCPFPAAPNGVRRDVYGGTAMMLFREAQYPDEAMRWIHYVTRRSSQFFIMRHCLTHPVRDGKILFISCNREVWESPESAWGEAGVALDPELRAAVVEGIYGLASNAYVIGQGEVQRPFENLFELIRDEATTYASQQAAARGVTRREWKRRIAGGEWPGDWEAFGDYLDGLVDGHLDELVPKSQAVLDRERERYETSYASIAENIGVYSRAADILDAAAWISMALIAGSILAVVVPRRTRRHLTSYLFVAPPLLLMLVFLVIPIVVSVYLSFTVYNPLLPLSTASWVGPRQFGKQLAQEEFWQSMGRSFTYALTVIPAHLLLGMVLAVWLNALSLSEKRLLGFRAYRGLCVAAYLLFGIGSVLLAMYLAAPLTGVSGGVLRWMSGVGLLFALVAAWRLSRGQREAWGLDRIFKFTYFSPLVTSIVSISLIWSSLYVGASYGWFNAILLKLGIIADPVNWLQKQATFLPCVIVMSIWQGMAFVVLIYMAGLQNIPAVLYEAASIDGAGGRQRFTNVTVPGLYPQITFLLIMGGIGAIQVFEQIFILGRGFDAAQNRFGVNDSGMTVVCYIFQKAFMDFQMGEASAAAYMLFMVIFAITSINWRVMLRRTGP